MKRTNGGVRDYSEEDLNRIYFIKCKRHVGLSIDSIRAYILLNDQGDSTLTSRLEILLNEREKLENSILSLQETLDYLNKKIALYKKISG